MSWLRFRAMIFALLLALASLVSVADEMYEKQDCPGRTGIGFAGAIVGAGIVYGLTTPNIPQQNGITFVSSLALGALVGGFTGVLIAQSRCNKVALTGQGIQVCLEF